MTKKKDVGSTKALVKNVQEYFDISDSAADLLAGVFIKILFKTLGDSMVVKHKDLGVAEIQKTNTKRFGTHYLVRVHPTADLRNLLRGTKIDTKSTYRTLNKLLRLQERGDEIETTCSDVLNLANTYLPLAKKYTKQQLMALLSERKVYSNKNEDNYDIEHEDSIFLGEIDD